MGGTNGIRYGPRPIDLDILFYGKFKVHSDILTIPHERIWERPFVMAPLMDLLGSVADCDTVTSWHTFSLHTGGLELWEKMGGESLIVKEGMIKSGLWGWSQRTSVMGILNVTPDSFSDCGKLVSVESALSQVCLMISEGAEIIDIGAQSTRPMASWISTEEELDRLIPVLEAVVWMPEAEGKFISVDIFDSEVASEAIGKGAHLVNDVSTGQLDSNMFRVVAGLKVPYVAMHKKGSPSKMLNSENVQYDDVYKQIASELYLQVKEAELSGIPAWRIMIDPGIGFSKRTEHNLDILRGLPSIHAEIARKSLAVTYQKKKKFGCVSCPNIYWTLQKEVLGDICSRTAADERGPATIASVGVSVLGANIVREHNVKR